MASTHAARAVVPFPLPSCYPLPFFLTLTSPPLLSHTASLPPFSSLLQNREETFVFRRDRGAGGRGRKTRKGKGKAKKWEERGNVVVEEFFYALPLCVFFSLPALSWSVVPP